MQNNQIVKKYTLKNFIPLITAFGLVIVLALFLYIFIPRIPNSFSYDIMGSFFIIFGLVQLIQWHSFVMAFSTYDLLARMSSLYAYCYPLIEITLGICYLVRFQLRWVNSITLAIMLVSSMSIIIALFKKEQMTCACLGGVFNIPLTYVSLIEDSIMAIMAFWMLIKGHI